MLSQFELELPETLDEALDRLANGNGATSVPLAGGTSLIVDIRARRTTPEAMIWLGRMFCSSRLRIAAPAAKHSSSFFGSSAGVDEL